MSYSNISAELSAEQLAQVVNSIKTLKNNLPFLINLSPEERQSLRKMGDKLTSFVQDVHITVLANQSVIPNNIDLKEFSKDLELFEKLDIILAELKPLYEALSDTSIVLGNEAIKTADICYGYLKYAARSNSSLDQTVQTLSARFKRNRSAETEPVVLQPSPVNTPSNGNFN